MKRITFDATGAIACLTWCLIFCTENTAAADIYDHADFIRWITNSTDQRATLYGNITLTEPLPPITRSVSLFGGTPLLRALDGGYTHTSTSNSMHLTTILCSLPYFTALTVSQSSEAQNFSMTGITWSSCGTALAFVQSNYTANSTSTVDISDCIFKRNGMGTQVCRCIAVSFLNSRNLCIK